MLSGADSDGLAIQPGLPTMVSPKDGIEISLAAAAPALRGLAARLIERSGGILFRGFGAASTAAPEALSATASVQAFRHFAASFGNPLIGYELASTPRSLVGEAVYTSTEYPSHRSIPLHNEQSYTKEWPMRIWFHCALGAAEGGATPIADSRAIYKALDPALVAHFRQKGLRYTRNFGQGLDLPWQQVFGTDQRHVVEQCCASRAMDFAWRRDEDGEWLLRTEEHCQATAVHPRTGEHVWFNQAHLFHLSGLDDEVQQLLLETVGEANVPRNVYYGDGTPLEPNALAEIRGVLAAQRVSFDWREGDVLMLDNMLTAHGRDPFRGARKVYVAMAESHKASPSSTLAPHL